jgi:hypothetical protein
MTPLRPRPSETVRSELITTVWDSLKTSAESRASVDCPRCTSGPSRNEKVEVWVEVWVAVLDSPPPLNPKESVPSECQVESALPAVIVPLRPSPWVAVTSASCPPAQVWVAVAVTVDVSPIRSLENASLNEAVLMEVWVDVTVSVMVML